MFPCSRPKDGIEDCALGLLAEAIVPPYGTEKYTLVLFQD